MTTVAVVIVNYNTCDLVHACLQSVLAAARYAGLSPDILVVDNASDDGSAAAVAAEFPPAEHPHVHLLALPRNIGFTAANNLALASLGFDAPVPPDLPVNRAAAPLASPDFVLLLNPDAELTLGSLRHFVQEMARLPRAGVLGPHLQYGDGSFQHGAFAFPSLAQVALDFFPLLGVPGAHRLHNSRLNGRYGRRQWEGTQPFAVDFVLGAAMFVRGAAIRSAGGLDPQFWMYCEEMDWCLRMKEAGWEVYAAPGVRVIHHEAQSSRQVRWWAFARLWRSRFRFYAKHRRRYGWGYLVAVRGLVRLGASRQRRAIEAQFARGEITGVTAGEALRALEIVSTL